MTLNSTAKGGSNHMSFARTGALACFAFALGLLISSLSNANGAAAGFHPVPAGLASAAPM
jgi:hypothetical protein